MIPNPAKRAEKQDLHPDMLKVKQWVIERKHPDIIEEKNFAYPVL